MPPFYLFTLFDSLLDDLFSFFFIHLYVHRSVWMKRPLNAIESSKTTKMFLNEKITHPPIKSPGGLCYPAHLMCCNRAKKIVWTVFNIAAYVPGTIYWCSLAFCARRLAFLLSPGSVLLISNFFTILLWPTSNLVLLSRPPRWELWVGKNVTLLLAHCIHHSPSVGVGRASISKCTCW